MHTIIQQKNKNKTGVDGDGRPKILGGRHCCTKCGGKRDRRMWPAGFSSQVCARVPTILISQHGKHILWGGHRNNNQHTFARVRRTYRMSKCPHGRQLGTVGTHSATTRLQRASRTHRTKRTRSWGKQNRDPPPPPPPRLALEVART